VPLGLWAAEDGLALKEPLCFGCLPSNNRLEVSLSSTDFSLREADGCGLSSNGGVSSSVPAGLESSSKILGFGENDLMLEAGEALKSDWRLGVFFDGRTLRFLSPMVLPA